MKYMLDTDTVSDALRGVGGVGARVLSEHPSELCASAVTLAELRFGAHRRASRKLQRLITTFFTSVAVLPFDEAAADVFGRIAADLIRRGLPIGQGDAMIAAHALSLDLTVVTNNVAHFSRVRQLSVESWA